MLYLSTRGQAPALDFRGVTLAGLASDGGLYVPQTYPRLTAPEIAALASCDYPETARRVLEPFVGDALTRGELGAMLRATYAGWGDPATVPLVELGSGEWLLELHHGPTLAFKDVAMGWLGRLLPRFLGGARLTLLVATSGDTGAAANHAFADADGIEVVMLHPRGRISEVQRRQMTTVAAANIHNLAVGGDFDACQALVKRVLAAPPPGRAMGAVNSINWARLAAQVAYYFHAAARLGAPSRRVSFAVPTGNFGDVFAGYVALRMGLPVARLIVATNANDILARALATGDYSRAPTRPTTSPSMDIQVSSNFERLLFELMDRDPARLGAAMADFEVTGTLQLEPGALGAARATFAAAAVSDAEAAATMRDVHARHGHLIDPHTAVGLAAARRIGAVPGAATVTLATAHPAKFPDAVEAATGVRPALPERLAGLMAGEERMTEIAADEGALRGYLAGLPA